MLFAGVDHTGTALYHLDPSGTYIRCIAKAIGAGGDGAEQALIEHCKECDKVSFQIKKLSKPFLILTENDISASTESCVNNT